MQLQQMRGSGVSGPTERAAMIHAHLTLHPTSTTSTSVYVLTVPLRTSHTFPLLLFLLLISISRLQTAVSGVGNVGIQSQLWPVFFFLSRFFLCLPLTLVDSNFLARAQSSSRHAAGFKLPRGHPL